MVKKLRASLSTFALLLFGNYFSFASHIVGGDITVRYLSPNTFEVSMNYFRDCSGIAFPATVTVGVYDKVTNVLQQSFVMSPISTTTLALGDGCYTPTLCLEKRIYQANINLPNNANGYYLAYGECCRNAAITNIVTPASVGYVFYCEVPNPTLQNSSPTFSSTPDGYMCQNYVNTDLFAATDADGDVLVYSLTDPLQSSSNGPPGPAPYPAITWVGGYYTANPLGDPGMIINPANGTINTLPPTMGIFVLSVKVEEYRASVKIGEIRRDFQFQVTNCALLNVSINPGNPICLGTTSTITPSGASAGSSYLWSDGQTTSSIVVTPTATGSYDYTVTATNGPCIKVTSTTLVANPNPTATVNTAGNICAGQNNTLEASGGIAYSWSNGSPISSISVSPGTYTVWVTNAFNCSATATGIISPPVASSYTWTGAGATGANNWFDSNNWGNPSGCIPNCLTDVFIPNSPALAMSNSPDIGTGSGAAACKDITLATGNSITFSNVISELDVCGDFMDNGVILNNGGQRGTVKFMGTVAQNYIRSNTASGNPFYNVIIANTAIPLPTVTVKDGVGYKDLPIGSSGTLTFQSGVLITEGERLLNIINNSSAAITGHGPSAYVHGRIKRNLSVSTSYDFPVGNMPVYNNAYPYQLMNLNFSALAGLTDVIVSFENPLLANANGSGLPVNEITMTGQYTNLLDNGGTNTGTGYPGAVGGLWTVIPSSYVAATYNMILYGRNYDNQGAYEHTILKRNTFCPGIWTVNGAYTTSSVSGNVVSATRTGMIGFSQVAIAKVLVPLPVELIAFDATCVNQQTKISWATASETNNDYFTIERSCDQNLFQFETIQTVPGSGSSTTVKSYSYTDNDDTNGDCYYRLLQTDFNGTVTEYSPVSINCNADASFSFVGVLPNPADDIINILYSLRNESSVSIEITDARGKLVITRIIKSEMGLNKVELSLIGLSGGIYFVKLNDGINSFIKKVIKKD